MLAGLEILDMDGEAFGPVVVDRIGQQRAVVADRKRAEPQIFLALGQRGFVEPQLVGTACPRLAPPFEILPAAPERGPVQPVAVLLRHARIVFLDRQSTRLNSSNECASRWPYFAG